MDVYCGKHVQEKIVGKKIKLIHDQNTETDGHN